jgi:signal transduction histidine kinase
MAFIGDNSKPAKSAEALLIEAHEQERSDIASQLHDDIGQRMSVVTMDLDALSKALPSSKTETRDRLRAIADRALKVAKDIQALSHRLYPSQLQYLGLASASGAFCRVLSQQHDVEIAFRADGMPDRVPMEVALLLFRVLQEAVTNAVKHARVGQVEVTLRGTPGEIRLEIADAGVGFDPEAILNGHAPGLVGMRERARLLGGALAIGSRPGGGTSISASVPLPAADQPVAPGG